MAVYIFMAENDEYYGSQKALDAYNGLHDAYRQAGWTREEIDSALRLEIPDNAYFNIRGVYNYHGVGNLLFDDETILNWVIQKEKNIMKKLKRLLSVVLAGVLLSRLTACWFSQIVIYDSHYTPEAGQAGAEQPVTDETYNNLETEECESASQGNDFMFLRADKPMMTDTFNRPVYVSSIIEGDNVAGAPGLHYVAFEPVVINNWHTHEGGQILIATDGIGYHQIEGQPVEILYPGDVALCPPGEKHWHGGSADTRFAHIAANTNPELTGLEWFGRISDEEYGGLATEPRGN